MSSLKIFVSHTSQYGNLAKSLRMSLLALQSNDLLDIRIHEDMPGGTDWRKWIEESTREARAFILLYPHADMDMGWPNFEVARFFGRENDRDNQVIWIRNPDIRKWPAVFEPYQAYDATPDSIFKFFHEFFVKGLFTDGQSLNPEIGVITNKYYQIAKTAAQELSEQFAEAAIRPQYHARRIQISLSYDRDRVLDANRSMIEGNAAGMKMLEMSPEVDVTWSAVRRALGSTVEWPSELENQISSFTAGTIPPCLSPFSRDGEVYIPVITKSEIGQAFLRRITIIFVEANIKKLRSLLDWSMPDKMPVQVSTFILFTRVLLKIRYDVIEPKFQEAKYHSPSLGRCIEMCSALLDEYKSASVECQKIGLNGIDAFNMLFDPSLWAKLKTSTDEYLACKSELIFYVESLKRKESPDIDEGGELALRLDRLRANNAHWLEIATKQFECFVNMWQ